MKVYLKILQDKSILTAFLILFLIEGALQFDIYKPLLQKTSYAATVNRITDHPILKKEELSPNVLIVGTSIAYEGISIRLLNEKIKHKGLRAQTVAIPGASLMVQDLAVRKLRKVFPGIKYIIHINEVQMPWILSKRPSYPDMAMINEFPTYQALKKLKVDSYQLKAEDYLFLFSKLIAYRRDMGAFFFNPLKRVKDGSRLKRKIQKNLFYYENQYLPSLQLYKFDSFKECILKTKAGKPIPKGSDYFHQTALQKTCVLAQNTKLKSGPTETTKVYLKRLQNFYEPLKKHKVQIINVFPPLTHMINTKDIQNRIHFWKHNYKQSLGDTIIDLYSILPQKNNTSYYYDIIHLNRKGMLVFTNALAKELIEKIGIKKGTTKDAF